MATSKPTKTTRRPVTKITDLQLVEKRQRTVAEVATRLVAERGFAKTTVADIAREADMSIGLLYAYVRTKEDILYLIVEYWGGVWEKGLQSAVDRHTDPLRRILAALEFHVEGGQKYPDVINLFYRESGHLDGEGLRLFKQGEEAHVDLLLGLINDAVRAGLLREGIDADFMATALTLLSHGWVLKSRFRKSRTPRSFARLTFETFVGAYGTDEAKARLAQL